jgi:hypothetical protein
MAKFDREELRTLVRQALKEALGAGAAAKATPTPAAPPPSRAGGLAAAIRDGRTEIGVAVRNADDLARFARDVAEASAEPSVKAAILGGKVRFVLAGAPEVMPTRAVAAPAASAAAYEMKTGVLSETKLVEIARSHKRIALGAEVVLTPLARDKAREMKVELTRQKP